MQNFVKISQTVSKISRFFDFEDGRYASSWILKFFNFWFPVRLGGLICIAVPKFHQNQLNGCRDIAFNVFQNGGRPPSWIFKNSFIEHFLGFEGLICVSMQNFVEIGPTIAEI